jgi:AraC-like DNA-binding protein
MKKIVLDGSLPYIRGALVAPLVRVLDSSDLDADALLAEFGISRRLLSNPYEVVPLSRYVSTFERLAALLDEPALGLRLGKELQTTDLGPAGFVFLSSMTLRSAINNFSRVLASWQSGTICELHSEGDWATWTYRFANQSIWPRQQDSDYTLASMCSMIRLVLGTAWNPIEVNFEHPKPKDDRSHKRFFRATLNFAQPLNGLTLRGRDLETPLRTADLKLAKMMEHHAKDLIEQASVPKDVVEQIRNLVQRRLAYERLTIVEIADVMCISTRTLQRHLSSQGTSVRQIIREVRMQCNDGLEQRDGLSNASIAQALGYADATVLWRARRLWKRSQDQ